MGRKLYVGNLPFSVDSDLLHQIFSQVGTVESVRIINDRETGRSKGYAFVEMASDQSVVAAIDALNGQDCEGRAMTVSEARPQSNLQEMRPQQGRPPSGQRRNFRGNRQRHFRPPRQNSNSNPNSNSND